MIVTVLICVIVSISYCVFINNALNKNKKELSSLNKMVEMLLGNQLKIEQSIRKYEKKKTKKTKHRSRGSIRRSKVSANNVPKSKILCKFRGHKNKLQAGGKG